MAAPEASGLEMAHILFVDLVGYSTLPMDLQRAYLNDLQEIVRGSAAFQAAERAQELLRLPTGDGMALVFFRDPVAPAQCATEVAAVLKDRPHLKLRMGVHTGPVYRVADINTNLNAAGGGMNLAQRVMDCGDAGHILVSRSVAEVLGQLSQWTGRLQDLGEHAVKHGVKVHLYNLVSGGVGNCEWPQRLRPPARSGLRRALVAGALAAVALAGVGVWRWPRTPAPAPASEHALNYFVSVQKFRDGKPFQQPFRLAGEINFEKDYRIAVHLSSPRAGHLYILNEGTLTAAGVSSLNVLYPYPKPDSVSVLPAGREVRIPEQDWFFFDEQGGTEKLYLVWAARPVAELEEVKGLQSAMQHGVVVLQEPARVRPLLDLFARHRVPASQVQKDEESRQTAIRGRGEMLVHLLRLEHH